MNPLPALIREIIRDEGPIGIDRFMALALAHPVHGYYATRDPLGAAGDFTTAPEISQMFGELLGLWAAEVWAAMGRPDPVALVELGPGRGTLMADALRAARLVPAFREAIRLHLVETSAVLRARQEAALGPAGMPIAWHAAPDTVPPGPAIVLANEFLDALPIRQAVRMPTGWHERLVGLGPEGGLAFGVAEAPDRTLTTPGREGEILEIAEAAGALVAGLARRLARQGGAALFVDYGHLRSGPGDTLQAVRGHGFADPLATPGEADLTAHVDFEALGRAARAGGAAVHGPLNQRDYLRALGIESRAEQLKRTASPEAGGAVEAALARLLGPGPGGMGDLFKVVAIAGPGLPGLPGLPGPPVPEPARAAEAFRTETGPVGFPPC